MYLLEIFMYYNNLLWVMSDKISLRNGDCCFRQLDGLWSVCFTNRCSCSTFPLHPGQWKDTSLLRLTHSLSSHPLPTTPTWGNQKRELPSQLNELWQPQCFAHFNVYSNLLGILLRGRFWFNRSGWDIALISNKISRSKELNNKKVLSSLQPWPSTHL